MDTLLKHFKGSIIISIIGLCLGFYLGGLNGLFIVALLSIMEISLSFDNAVVNAKILDKMDKHWQDLFLTVGMVIAVFGMRFLFPILVVSLATGLGLYESFSIGLNDPHKYGEILHSNIHMINGFGGAFLFMIFIKFLLDNEKEIHWIHWFEEKAIKFGKLEGIEVALTLFIVLIVTKILPEELQLGFLFAAVAGIVTYEAVNMLADVLSEMNEEAMNKSEMQKITGKAGIGLFLYLEILDASFSFDGVIGAFALSNNFFIITIGLAVGAMFVRSLTIMLVNKGTLNEYIYLEHGAHYAIGILGILMFINTFNHVPELITGLVGIGFILFSFYSSLQHNKKMLLEKKENNN